MRKLFYSALAIVALASCEKNETSVPSENGAFTIDIVTPSSKAAFDESTYAVTWKENEQLRVLINETAYTFTKVADSQTAFECADFTPVEGTTYNYEVLTPYNSSYGEGVFTYSGGVKVTMYGKGTAVGTAKPLIQMQHLTALIKTNIKNTGTTDITLNAIRIESDTDNMGGRYKISDGTLTAVNPVKYTLMESQNLVVKAGETGSMFVQCAPFTTTVGSKLTITLTSGSDTFKTEKTMTSAVTFTAGKVNSTTVEIKKEASAVDENDAKSVFVDFGPTGSSYVCSDTKWNVFSSAAVCDPVALKKADGTTASGLSLAVTSAFTQTYGGNGSEPGDLTEKGITFPKLVWKDGLQVSNSTKGVLEISGCTAGAKYTIKTISARYNGSFGIRLSKITVGGTSTQIDCGGKSAAELAAHEFVAIFEGVAADTNGKIEVDVEAVLGSNSSAVQGFINAMIIIPE